MKIRIGTRGSKLALWQAYFVQDALKNAGAETEILIIETKGDKILDRSLSKIGSKGVFTEELEEKLRNGEIDIAVHSAKDVQSRLDEDLEIIAFTKRETANDVLVSDTACSLNDDIVVGTSSTRRVALLKAYFPNIRIVDMRGNLQTRLQKMRSGHCDALLLAYAGVHRMEYDDLIRHKIELEKFTPAVGQGTIALEAATGLAAEKKKLIREACNHPETEQCLLAERSFLRIMNGGCSIPVFGYAKIAGETSVELNAGMVSLDGNKILRVVAESREPAVLGEDLAYELLAKGGKELLAQIRSELDK
jgi:hydroxymethylbilane synthase